ncbi:MAG: hypothetical protein FJ117_05130 [Deltaproteobacteria bacterium]|nr:hypothetical protein [Deltaproteobacteria bacterium]
MQGAQNLRSEAYLQVRCNDEGEAQRRRWTFYETITIGLPRASTNLQGFSLFNPHPLTEYGDPLQDICDLPRVVLHQSGHGPQLLAGIQNKEDDPLFFHNPLGDSSKIYPDKYVVLAKTLFEF